jgi:cardiolipin synthase
MDISPSQPPPSVATFVAGTGDKLTVFSDYRAWIAQLIADLDRAEHEIVMEMYTFEPDGEGGDVADALLRAAARGVRVRLMVDGLGCRFVPPEFLEWLSDGGIRVRIYHPVHLWSFLLHPGKPFRRRNHRKLMVVDGRIGHLGGMNLGARFADWVDLALRVEGPSAAQLRESHEHAWEGHYRKPMFMPWRRRGILPEVHFLDNYSDEQYSPIKKHYLHAIKRARRRILMAQAYFFPDKRLRKELRKAARRGVAVEIVAPESSDIAAVDYAARHVFRKLLRDGVRIYLFRGAKLHAKAAVVDDDWMTLGSANLDPISLFSCLEINASIQHRPLIAHLTRVIEDYQSRSVEYDIMNWVRRMWPERLLDWLWYHARRWYAKWG